MRTFKLMLAIIIFMTVNGVCQIDPNERKARMLERVETMADSLFLDSMQRVVFKNAFDQYYIQRFKLREKYRGDREKIMEENDRLRQAQNAQIKSILSDEQWSKYLEIVEKRRDRMRSRRSGK